MQTRTLCPDTLATSVAHYRNLGNLMHVAEVQYQRQLKTLQAVGVKNCKACSTRA